MSQQHLFDSRRARDAGIAKTSAANNPWIERALTLIPGMKAAGFITCTGEDIRNWLLSNGLGAPGSPNAWGALVNTAVHRKLLRDTERVGWMKDVRSHARRTPLWELI